MHIGIAIVDYGDPKWLKECMLSLEMRKGHEKQLDVFDIKTFDCNKENIGFSKANNILIDEFIDGGRVSWVWLLNNDTVIEPGTLSSIHDTLKIVDPKVGIIGFKILSLEDEDLIHHAGTTQAFPAGIHKSGSVKLRQFEEPTYEKWVTFASVLIRVKMVREIGLLDGRMFNFYSDSDYCYRARYAGWKVKYQPEFVIKHKIGQSAHPSPVQIKILEADGILFQNKWLNAKSFFDLDMELV
jgi:hypothetical protein